MPALPSHLPRICVALGFSKIEGLIGAAEREYKDGSTFFEFRLDTLRSPTAGVRFLSDFARAHSDAYVLATCRNKTNGGGFNGDLTAQLQLLADAGSAGAAAIDLEIEAAEVAEAEAQRLRARTPLIVSYHNFASTPALKPVYRRLTRVAADGYKIATTARKLSDTKRLVDFTRLPHQHPLIALAMSDLGVPSRLLAPALDVRFTYGAPAEGEPTASGQMAARTMRQLYRVEKLSRQTRIYGVVADPVMHSRSPALHNRAFQARRIDAVYVPVRVPAAQLGDWMKLANCLPVQGFSVTIPHKTRVARYLDQVDPLARRIGAVNTVWRKGGKWRGTNTDAAGVLIPLQSRMRLQRTRVLLAGYGGAARAAAFALSDAGARLWITGRDKKRAGQLAQVVGAEVLALPEAVGHGFDVIVNATPVGMHPSVDGCIFPNCLPHAEIVFDMVYNPQETRLLRQARQQGAQVISGSEMLIEQAAQQFAIWTDDSPPRAIMQQAWSQAFA